MYRSILIFCALLPLAACGNQPPAGSGSGAAIPAASGETASAPTTAAQSPAVTPTSALPTLDPTIAAGLSGTIVIDGSSTVFPITEAVANQFSALAPGVSVQLGVSGTGGGFKKFCAGEIDIANASRPIKQSEMDDCAAAKIGFVEVPVAFDGLTVVVHPDNAFVGCLTVDELRRLWEPAATNVITAWQQIRPEWPAAPIRLYGAGHDSGTFDYFTTAIVGAAGASRSDYIGSEDDYLLVQDIAADPQALGYFGYAYYREFQDRLKLVAIDGGAGCVAPSEAAIADGSYQPLSRPIFIYVRSDALDRPEVRALVDFYLADTATVVQDVKYVPLPPRAYQLAARRVAARKTGSIFGGGSQVGVSIEQLLVLEDQ